MQCKENMNETFGKCVVNTLKSGQFRTNAFSRNCFAF